MRTYNKKDFTIVPSRQARIGMPANQQVVYMWLCEHSDDNNQSFPSRKVLAYECGISVRTLDRAIAELLEKGYIAKSARHFENRQSSNLYEVVIVTRGDKSAPLKSEPFQKVAKKVRGGATKSTLGGDKIDTQNSTHITQPIENNSTNVELAKPLNGSPEINDMFQLWAEIAGYPINSAVRANRYACSNLLKKFSKDGLTKLIQGAVLARADKYSGVRITDFVTMQQRLNALMAWGNSRSSNATAQF